MNVKSAALAACLVLAAAPAEPCTIAGPISPDAIVREAHAIVRAAAVDYARPPSNPNRRTTGTPDSRVWFRVVEVLKGSVPETIELPGYLGVDDDFNDGKVPYTFVRSNGRSGSCFANTYRQGAEFLLMLDKRRDGAYTVDWYALGPVNEQLRPAGDAWLSWVREQSAQSQPPAVPAAARQAAERITADRLSKDLDFLASDALAGRNTPSPGFDTAAGFIADRLKKAGLQPAGDDGTFFQRYTMREATVDTDAAALVIGGKRFVFGDDFVMRAFAGPVEGRRRIVYVGHGWTMPDKHLHPFAGLDVKDKIVLVHGPRALPKGVDIQAIGRINVGASSVFAEAARRGAAAVVMIAQESALADWAQLRTQSITQRELVPAVPSAYAAVPITAVMVSPQVADALMAGETIDGPTLRTRAETQDYPDPFQLTGSIELIVPAKSTVDHRPYNVVAMLRGSDRSLADEYVVIESHLDGAVGTRAVDGDAIYNSADDNASGSAGALAIAEALAAGPRTKRSILFVWDSGEERGLWGTRYFVHRPPVPLDRIVAEINVDMIGANRAPGTADADESRTTGPKEVYVIGPRVLSARAAALLDRVNREYLNLRFNSDHDRADSEFFYPRTDAGPFLERRILTIGFTTGIHRRYHLPSDEARFLDPGKIEAIARTILVSAWALADAAERPGIDLPVPATVPDYRR